MYRGTLRDGLQVAIKCIEVRNGDEFSEHSKNLKVRASWLSPPLGYSEDMIITLLVSNIITKLE